MNAMVFSSFIFQSINYFLLTYEKTVLKLCVDNTILLLIEAEGARLLREKRVKGRPRRSDSDEEAPGLPAIAKCLQRKSTGKINMANEKKRELSLHTFLVPIRIDYASIQLISSNLE
ncbi:hypothetical protein FSZ17_20425 [Cytobacillus dafuensis]|uniref:Uncharacterized protein n=1 Tax=Cytobacillus dafuensis TaxID=1742359 RepID=A0A5B8Z8Z8_CYTDA|nr:hypothetical protein FSZ17_20425 [Cytobacillus dafuensis]